MKKVLVIMMTVALLVGVISAGTVDLKGVHAAGKTGTVVISASDSAYRGDFHCTGSNDHLVIQHVIDDVLSSNGTIVLLEGTFSIGDTIDLRRTSINLIGQGKYNTTLSLAAGVNADVIVDGDGAAMFNAGRIAHLGIEGNASGQTAGSGIRLKSATNMLIEDVYITDCKGHGIYAHGSPGITPGIVNIRNSYISHNGGNGYYQGQYAENIVLEGCFIGDNGTAGTPYIYNVRAELGGVLTIANCVLWQPCGSGASEGVNLSFHAFQHAQVVGGMMLSAPQENILFTGTATRQSAMITVTGVQFHSCSEFDGTDYHIQLGTGENSSCSSVTISGNVFSQPAAVPSAGVIDENPNSSNNSVGANALNTADTAIGMAGTGSHAVIHSSSGVSLDGGNFSIPNGALVLGADPASTGQIRMSNNQAIQWRNAANNADQVVIYLDSNDNVLIAHPAVTNNITLRANTQLQEN